MTLKREWKSPDVRVKPSQMNKKFKSQHTYAERRATEKDVLAARESEQKMKDAFKARRTAVAKKSLAKAERKKNADIQKGNIQVVKNTKKLRKYDRKAMQSVIKMSHEQIEALSRR